MHAYIVTVGLVLAAFLAASARAITVQEAPAPAPAVAPEGDSAGAANVAPQIKESNGIRYVSGGRGTEERDELGAAAGAFNLALTTATPDGKLTVADSIRISNQQGKALLETTPDGPVFLAKLPPGAYSLLVTLGGEQQTRAVMVSNVGRESLTLTMREATDGDLPAAGDAPPPAAPRPNVAPADPRGAATGQGSE